MICWKSTALAELDAISELLFGSNEVVKALPNPLTERGFDQWVERYSRAVRRVARTQDARAVKAMVNALQKSWAKLSESQRNRLIDQAVKQLSISEAGATKISKTIANNMEQVIRTTKRRAKASVSSRIDASFDAIDEAIVRHVRTSQAHFIRDEYRRRQIAASNQARRIVASGVDRGLDSTAIGEELAKRMTELGITRSEAYWNVVSSIFSARGRAYGLAASYSSAGIERYRWVSVLDEVTTPQCNFLHDKVFTTSTTLDRYREVAASDDPEDVATLQPFMQYGRDNQGNEILYYREGRNGPRRLVAQIVTNPAGQRDNADAGVYRRALSESDLQDAGMSMPPIHGFCRSTTIPA